MLTVPDERATRLTSSTPAYNMQFLICTLKRLGRAAGQLGASLIALARSHLPPHVLSSHFQAASLSSGPATKIIIIAISYSSMLWNSGYPMQLKGTPNDLRLLLERFQYRHDDTSGRIQVLTDVELEFRDSRGVTQVVKCSPPTRKNIEYCVQSTAQRLKRSDKLLVWYGGHAKPAPGKDRRDLSAGYLVPLDKAPLYGFELLQWITNRVCRDAQIITVFDACYSENLLGLPISYTLDEGRCCVRGIPAKPIQQTLVVISAAKVQQQAYSSSRFDTRGLHGVMTWCLLELLRVILPIEDLARYLTEDIGSSLTPGRQQSPVISSSKPLGNTSLALIGP